MSDWGWDYKTGGGAFSTEASPLSKETGSTFKTTYGNGSTAGWLVNLNANTRDRSTSVDTRLMGILFTGNGTQQQFQVDIPTGTYTFALALGDFSYAQTFQHAEGWDGSTAGTQIFSVDKSTGTAAAQWYDVTGVARTAAGWVSNNATTQYTMATTTLLLVLGASGAVGGSSTLSHFRVTTASAVGSVVTPRGLPMLGAGS